MGRDLGTLKQYFAAQKIDGIDLTRGIPNADLLRQAEILFDEAVQSGISNDEGVDLRNYGSISGLAPAKAIGAELLNCSVDRVCVGSNSSLSFFHQFVSALYFKGMEGHPAWQSDVGTNMPVQVICTVPGYDRHFAMLQNFGIQMLNVPMLPNGPDIDSIANCLATHTNIRGMIGVPTNSNPGGENWSDSTMKAALQQISHYPKSIMLMLDDAYSIHDFSADNRPAKGDTFAMAEQIGIPNSIIKLASTSKITFAGSGVSFLASSPANNALLNQYLQGISMGGDKYNQAVHIKMFQMAGGVTKFFAKYCAPWLKARFDLVETQLCEQFGDYKEISWSHPKGGYFVLLKFPPGTATKILQTAQPLVKLTNVGAPFPYGLHSSDCYIRLAPTFPDDEQIVLAIEVLAASAKQVIEKV